MKIKVENDKPHTEDFYCLFLSLHDTKTTSVKKSETVIYSFE